MIYAAKVKTLKLVSDPKKISFPFRQEINGLLEKKLQWIIGFIILTCDSFLVIYITRFQTSFVFICLLTNSVSKRVFLCMIARRQNKTCNRSFWWIAANLKFKLASLNSFGSKHSFELYTQKLTITYILITCFLNEQTKKEIASFNRFQISDAFFAMFPKLFILQACFFVVRRTLVWSFFVSITCSHYEWY